MLFAELTKLLGIEHRISAVLAPRTNGLAESLVKRVSELLKIYCTDGRDIEISLPLIEINVKTLIDLLFSIRVMTDDLH